MRIVAGLCGLRQIRQIKRHTVIMLAVTTDSLAKVLVLCTISVMMCCIKPYWNDCSIGAKAVQQDEEKVLNKIQKAGNAERIREKKKKASALKKAENRQNEIDRLFTKMYEDRACEKITERNFIMLSGKYQKEQIELEQQITNLREELSKMEQDMIGAEKWIELIKEYSVPKELTAPLLNAMIEKILIHEATTNEDNERIQEIEIYYRFIGKVD